MIKDSMISSAKFFKKFKPKSWPSLSYQSNAASTSASTAGSASIPYRFTLIYGRGGRSHRTQALQSKGSHDNAANAPRPIVSDFQEQEPRRDAPKSDPRAPGGNALVQ